MGKLLLTSGGYLDGQRGKECDEIIENLAKDKNVLFVDNATLTGSNLKGIPIILENFKKISKNVTQISLNEDNLEEINKFDVIYITGGDVTPLIELNLNCNLKNAFEKYLIGGGNIIGESAGSIIFGKELKWLYDIKKGSKPKYDVVLNSYSGIGLVDINFFPHWNKASEDMKQNVKEYENQHKIKITRVNDGEFLVFNF